MVSAPVQPGSKDCPLQVSAVVKIASRVLERELGAIWLEGETTSVSRPSSGHIYFGLKDNKAQIKAVMWKSDAQRLKFRLEEGQKLLCRGRLAIYERDGKFQYYVQAAEPAGLGAQALALEQLRKKLAAEGVFDLERKRPLPRLPKRIGVVTSKSGAAIRDIVKAVQRRFPVPILLADAVVQGGSAPRAIVRGIRALGQSDVDVIIVGRGGGSASDLSAFDNEAVVRAIADCPKPVVSAVGHEVDTSLSDLAADKRAATPTMAGQMVVPDRDELYEALERIESRLHREATVLIRSLRQELDSLLGDANTAMIGKPARMRRELARLQAVLETSHPRRRLDIMRRAFLQLSTKLDQSMTYKLDRYQRQLRDATAKLDALSPLRVLSRGYAIASKGGHVVTNTDDVKKGDKLEVRLGQGSVGCKVEQVLKPLALWEHNIDKYRS